MNRKGLSILMRTRMRSPPTVDPSKRPPIPFPNDVLSPVLLRNAEGFSVLGPEEGNTGSHDKPSASRSSESEFELVRESMHSAISMHKTEVLDGMLNDFTQGYFSLAHENRRKLLLILARDYDLKRTEVRELMKQYLGLELPNGEETEPTTTSHEGDGLPSALYRTERNLRHLLNPMYEILFERLNKHVGGLGFLSFLRADILAILKEENSASLRALDSYLKEKLVTWLSPAALELLNITWNDSASLLEKIVAYEAVHPIKSLIDLKRRLGLGRRCFGYFHPAISGEPLIFIEVALLKNVAQTIQEVLWDDPPIAECEATCALFYSISSTQPGLAGINLGKFLIKRVIELVKRDMPHISTFATLSPVPGFMHWLLSKLACQTKLAAAEAVDISHSSADKFNSVFKENILTPDEEKSLLETSVNFSSGKSGLEVMQDLLTSSNHEWTNSDPLLLVLKDPLMRLCARYLLQEKKRGKALDSVANFHLQNGAMVERLNWLADRSGKGLSQSAGIMVNYVYRLDGIEENAQSYFSTGHIPASSGLHFSTGHVPAPFAAL